MDAKDVLDSRPMGRFQLRVVMLCAAVIALDGFDTQALGFVAPVLSREWGLPPGALGPVFGAALTGMLIGAVALGSLADFYGRKPFIVAGTLVFGAGALATIGVHSLEGLLIVRFLTGLGLGGVMPNAIALTSEYSSRRQRTFMVMVMFSAVTVGSALGGVLAARLIPGFGWRGVFWAGALLPLALLPALLVWLPESLHVLVARSDYAGVERVMRHIDARISAETVDGASGDERQQGFRLLHLFRHGRAVVTLLVWAMFFMNLLDIYFLNNWLPTLFSTRGLGVNAAILISVMFQAGGALGTFGLGWLIGRFGFYSVLSVNFAVGSASIVALGWPGATTAVLAACAFVAGACAIGGQGGCNALAVQVYPAFVRSTGVGWALGVGRAGSIVGPVVGGLMLAAHWNVRALFAASALPQVCAAVLIMAIGLVGAGEHGFDEPVRAGVAPTERNI